MRGSPRPAILCGGTLGRRSYVGTPSPRTDFLHFWLENCEIGELRQMREIYDVQEIHEMHEVRMPPSTLQ